MFSLICFFLKNTGICHQPVELIGNVFATKKWTYFIVTKTDEGHYFAMMFQKDAMCINFQLHI